MMKLSFNNDQGVRTLKKPVCNLERHSIDARPAVPPFLTASPDDVSVFTNEMNEPKLEVTGLWIPLEVWNRTDLSWLEKCLLVEIDGCGGKKGKCYAGNEWLAGVMGMTAGSVAVAISKFRKLGLIKDVGNNQKRLLLTTYIEPLAITKPPLAITKTHIDKNQGKELKKDDTHEAVALWIQSHNRHNPETPYANTVAKRRKADEKAMNELLSSGRSPAAVGELADRMFTVAETRDEKKFWRCCKVTNIEQFCQHIGDIQNELKLRANGVLSPIGPEVDDHGNKRGDFFYGTGH